MRASPCEFWRDTIQPPTLMNFKASSPTFSLLGEPSALQGEPTKLMCSCVVSSGPSAPTALETPVLSPWNPHWSSVMIVPPVLQFSFNVSFKRLDLSLDLFRSWVVLLFQPCLSQLAFSLDLGCHLTPESHISSLPYSLPQMAKPIHTVGFNIYRRQPHLKILHYVFWLPLNH